MRLELRLKEQIQFVVRGPWIAAEPRLGIETQQSQTIPQFPDNCSPNDIPRLADPMYTGSICCQAGVWGLALRSVLQNTYSLQQLWQGKGLMLGWEGMTFGYRGPSKL